MRGERRARIGAASRALLCSLAGLASIVSAARAGDAGHGKVLSARCIACHGPAGHSDDPMVPDLAGQHGIYLYRQLQEFKAGTRKNPLMSPVAQALADSDMDDLATYYAGLVPQGQANTR